MSDQKTPQGPTISEPFGSARSEQLDRARIAQKLAAVMGAISTVPKDSRNEHHKYNYSSDATMFRAVRVPLMAEGLAIVTTVDDITRVGEITTVAMTVTIIDVETGYSIESRSVGQGKDGQDKGVYKAITGALKYWCKAMFLLPTGDDPEEVPKPEARGRQNDAGPIEQEADRIAGKIAAKHDRDTPAVTEMLLREFKRYQSKAEPGRFDPHDALQRSADHVDNVLTGAA